MKKLLPKGNTLPETTYDTRKVVCPLGFEAQKIHACPNDCILYHGEEYENLDACSVCKACRYKIPRDDPGDVEGVHIKESACQGDVVFPINTTFEIFAHEQNEW